MFHGRTIRQYNYMIFRHIASSFGAALVVGTTVLGTTVLGTAVTSTVTASAAACPDVEVVFARGTGEPPGLGGTGEAFVNDLRSKVGNKTVDVYPVDYPASIDFPTAVDGINDAANHIQATAAKCPKTKMVLGGFSQGAAVMGFVTSNAVPPGATDYVGNGPMAPEVAKHVAAVTLFGKPSPAFMGLIGQPAVTIGPLYSGKTLDSCVPGDPICSSGGDGALHNQYIPDGLVDQAAAYAASRV